MINNWNSLLHPSPFLFPLSSFALSLFSFLTSNSRIIQFLIPYFTWQFVKPHVSHLNHLYNYFLNLSHLNFWLKKWLHINQICLTLRDPVGIRRLECRVYTFQKMWSDTKCHRAMEKDKFLYHTTFLLCPIYFTVKQKDRLNESNLKKERLHVYFSWFLSSLHALFIQ